MSENEDPIYRIICCKDTEYCLTSRGDQLVFALTNPFDRYQHWIKDERYGATIKDEEGQPAFTLVNRGTGKAVSHYQGTYKAVGQTRVNHPLLLAQYNPNSFNESMLWTMSKNVFNGFGNIRRPDGISMIWVSNGYEIHDGRNVDLYVPSDPENTAFLWKIVKVLPSTCVSLFTPSKHTVKIICQAKFGYNLAFDKDGSTVLLVPSNPKDKYQHWIKETADGVPVKDEEGKEAFALVNKATGKAIKHGFGHNYLAQVAPFNRNYIDPSLLWTQGNVDNGFHQIRLQNNIKLAFNIYRDGQMDYPLLALSTTERGTSQQWKIEKFE